MSLRVKARVPATTANMGPGFDCLGMALALYNEVEFQVAEMASPCEGKETVPLSKNLIYRCFALALDRLGVVPQSWRLRMLKADIPVARGLGSSAACIVAGVLAARAVAPRLGGAEMSLAEAIDLSVEIEGHPDNVVPATVGGMTVAVMVEGPCKDRRPAGPRRVQYCRIDPPEDLTMAAIVPDFRLSTEEARGALPAQYDRADAVFNIGRAALLTACLASGDLSSLRTAVDDRIHQPYRLPLISHSGEVIEAARAAGSLAEFVSGSGPTIMALLRGDGAAFAGEVLDRLARIPGGWEVYLLKPERSGARVDVSGTGGNGSRSGEL
jgi:homoserine kinase